MQRIIKFRGKRVDNGHSFKPINSTPSSWVYGYYWRDNSNGKHKITVDLSDDNFICYEVLPETVGQFTGLTDKNGKEIYEGDIITGWTKAKEVVKYDELNARFLPIWFQYWDNDKRDKQMEVIGNIHEDGGLLEK